jgi:hypothetical protein
MRSLFVWLFLHAKFGSHKYSVVNFRLLNLACRKVRNAPLDFPNDAILPSRALLVLANVVCSATSTAIMFFACARALPFIFGFLRNFLTTAASTASK